MRSFWFWMSFFAQGASVAGGELGCFLETPVYNSQGLRMEVSAESVRRVDNGRRLEELLLQKGETWQVAWMDGRLAFSEALIGIVVEITMRSGKGSRLTRTIELRDCHGRASFQFGSQSSGGITAGSTLRGFVGGCPLVGDWWVRIFPMFGGYMDPAIDEAKVDSRTGAFKLTSSTRGQRHVLVIGRDRNAVKAVGIDVVEGADNQLGRFDIRRECPTR